MSLFNEHSTDWSQRFRWYDMVKASIISNLGEICKLLYFSLGDTVQEVSLLNEHSTDWSQRHRWYGES